MTPSAVPENVTHAKNGAYLGEALDGNGSGVSRYPAVGDTRRRGPMILVSLARTGADVKAGTITGAQATLGPWYNVSPASIRAYGDAVLGVYQGLFLTAYDLEPDAHTTVDRRTTFTARPGPSRYAHLVGTACPVRFDVRGAMRPVRYLALPQAVSARTTGTRDQPTSFVPGLPRTALLDGFLLQVPEGGPAVLTVPPGRDVVVHHHTAPSLTTATTHTGGGHDGDTGPAAAAGATPTQPAPSPSRKETRAMRFSFDTLEHEGLLGGGGHAPFLVCDTCGQKIQGQDAGIVVFPADPDGHRTGAVVAVHKGACDVVDGQWSDLEIFLRDLTRNARIDLAKTEERINGDGGLRPWGLRT